MAELIKLNEYMIGNPESYNISSLMQTLMESYRGKDQIVIMNANNNAGAPGIKGISVIDVAGSLYILSEDTVALWRNGDASSGSLESISNAPDGTYYLMLTDSVNGLQIIAASLINADFVYSHDYSGYYERYTTNKIIGRFTKSGTTYINKMKLYNEGTALLWLRGDGYLMTPFMQTSKIVVPDVRMNNIEIGGAGLTLYAINGQTIRLKVLADLSFSSYYWTTYQGPYLPLLGHTVYCSITKIGVNKIMSSLYTPGDYVFTAPSEMGYDGVITINYALGYSGMTLSDIMEIV